MPTLVSIVLQTNSGGSTGGFRGFKPPPWAAKKKKKINVHRKTPS